MVHDAIPKLIDTLKDSSSEVHQAAVTAFKQLAQHG
jgi:hypothetical protein